MFPTTWSSARTRSATCPVPGARRSPGPARSARRPTARPPRPSGPLTRPHHGPNRGARSTASPCARTTRPGPRWPRRGLHSPHVGHPGSLRPDPSVQIPPKPTTKHEFRTLCPRQYPKCEPSQVKARCKKMRIARRAPNMGDPTAALPGHPGNLRRKRAGEFPHSRKNIRSSVAATLDSSNPGLTRSGLAKLTASGTFQPVPRSRSYLHKPFFRFGRSASSIGDLDPCS